MKISLNTKTRKIEVKLGAKEEYNVEEPLHALTEFLESQAMLWFTLNSSCQTLVRLLSDSCQTLVKLLSNSCQTLR